MTRIIGLCGQARAGKDTVAAALVEGAGWQRMAFADGLRAALLELDPDVRVPEMRGWRWAPLHEALRLCGGWEGVKAVPGLGVEVRGMLQRLGMAVRRLDPDVWVRPVMAEAAASGCDVVITDVRFVNEAEAIREAGGTVVSVVRPSLESSDGHVSEVEWRSILPDFTVYNSFDLYHLRCEALHLDAIV